MIVRDRQTAKRALRWPLLAEYPRIAEAVRAYLDERASPERLRAKADSALSQLDQERRAALALWVSRTDEENAAAEAGHRAAALRREAAEARRVKR